MHHTYIVTVETTDDPYAIAPGVLSDEIQSNLESLPACDGIKRVCIRTIAQHQPPRDYREAVIRSYEQ